MKPNKKNLIFFISLFLSFFVILIGLKLFLLIYHITGWGPIIDLIRLPFSSAAKYFDVIAAWLPLVLVLSAILLAFRAGFWNIGVEGQIVIGAVFTTFIVRVLQSGTFPPFITIIIGLIFGAIGGGIWAFISAFMKTQSGVHEIVSGIGLNVLALGATNWLVLGPWKRFSSSFIGGTDMFNANVWLAQIGNLRITYVSIFVSLFTFIAVVILLHRTRFGLRLAAFHLNPSAKYIHAGFTSQTIWRTFIFSGMISGLTGAILTLGTYHRLLPSVSSGIGYIAILIVLMVNQQPIWAAIVAFIFSMTTINGTQLSMEYQLAPSIVGVFQAGWAFFLLIIYQSFERFLRGRE